MADQIQSHIFAFVFINSKYNIWDEGEVYRGWKENGQMLFFSNKFCLSVL